METSRPAKLDVRSLTKANLDASGVADASPLSARSKLRRFASTSDLPPAIQPPRMKKRHSIAVSADDDFADYHSHNLRHVDALHGDLLFLPANATAAKVVYSHETLLMCILCIVAGVGAVAPAALIVDQEPAAMQLVMLGNYLYMIFYSLVVQPRVFCDHEIPIRTHMRLVVAQFAYMQGQNIAFRLGMPMSIVLVLKNGGLVAQMLVGTFVIGERYHVRQVLAAAAVTVGIIISVRGDAPASDGGAVSYGVVLPTAVLICVEINQCFVDAAIQDERAVNLISPQVLVLASRDAPALARKRVDEARLRGARPPLQRSLVLPALPRITLSLFRAATPATNGQSLDDAGAAAVGLPLRAPGGQLRLLAGVRARRRLVERPAQFGADDDAVRRDRAVGDAPRQGRRS